MLKASLNAWVKNVYNMGKQTRITGVCSSPLFSRDQYNQLSPVHNNRLTPLVIRPLPQALSTPISAYLSLLRLTYTHNPQGLLLRLLKEN